MSDSPTNGWSQYQKLVLAKLESLEDEVKETREQIASLSNTEVRNLQIEVAMLKVKSGLWGAAAGFVPAALFVAYELISRG